MISVHAENLMLGYEGVPVVSDLNFEIKGGEFLCIFGENGSGKSTLIKAILGINKQLGGNLSVLSDDGKPQIGYLSQKNQISDNFPASVYEVVLSGCLHIGKFSPFATRAQKALCLNKMQMMGIDQLKNKTYGDLSGGQKQRVLLARALCSARDGLVLDEPVTGLDKGITEEMYEALETLKKEGITIIMVSHDVADAVKYADKVLYIGSKSNFFGTPTEYEQFETRSKV